MTKRNRAAKVRIAGEVMELHAPGLKQVRRRGKIQLYWAKDETPECADYRPATVRIHVDLSDPVSKETIEQVCQREHDCLMRWLEKGNDDKERLRPKFNGTMGSLCLMYESDPESGFADVQQNTQSSYRDWLKIVRGTIGPRRIDALTAKYFRTCYRHWKEPISPGEEHRVRRAYGCIQMVKILLGYGMQANLFYTHCERLLSGLSKMRFAKNPPRDSVLTYEHASAIVTWALEAGDISSALVQALQFECFLRQIDIVGKWRTVKGSYVANPGEVHHGAKVWSGMTMSMILTDNKILRVRTSKTGQYVVHDLDKCELVARCLKLLGPVDPEMPVARRKDGSPWPTHMDFGKLWREYADAAGVPKSVWNMDSKAGGITEAAGAGASHDDLAGSGAHATKTTTRKIYMRGAPEISARVQKARQSSRHGKLA
ncbi:hypothetical protein [Bradyrhizobium sp. WU425]|uniref:hypothetical protein n=1 Tax=Bradyrhizobium sp. WU425 TaxID=187029 RepID=UPI001E2D7C01|nr:hypothetical protein [Bradyrhizobium canariense]UFW72864.1 hypothetical protein BcanWU425_03590 [Bradyrhizobium canariense]